MFSEDYFMRMLRLAVAAITRIAGLRKAGQYQEALDEINHSLEQIFGMRASLVKSLDDESLLAALSQQGNLDVERAVVMGDLFKEEAEILAILKEPEAAATSFQRAIFLYTEAALIEGQELPPGLPEKIDSILHQLEGFELPPDTHYSLFCYFEQTAQYTRGENELNLLMRVPDWKEDIPGELESYYQRLLDKSPEELAHAGLTRDQVREKLAIWQNRTGNG